MEYNCKYKDMASFNKLEISIQCISWSEAATELCILRKQVFIEEQGVSADMEWDGLDESAWHWLAYTSNQQAVGCARLLETGQIGRVAVLPTWRRQGVGSKLVRTIIEDANTLVLSPLFMHAQSYIVPMYEKLGFVSEGETYEEANILHQTMIKGS